MLQFLFLKYVAITDKMVKRKADVFMWLKMEKKAIVMSGALSGSRAKVAGIK